MELHDFLIPSSDDILYANILGHIKIAIVREVTNPLVIKNDESGLTITKINEDIHLEIPARKFKAKEKLTGITLLRRLSKQSPRDLIDKGYRYNAVEKNTMLRNINSLLFGDSCIKEGNVCLKSRAIYDWGYSLRSIKEISQTLQHNALSETGTMLEDLESIKQRQSLFMTEYITPPVYFVTFITCFNINEIMLQHLLYCISFTYQYGGQSTVSLCNLRNHIIAVCYGLTEQPINSFVLASDKKFLFDEVGTLNMDNLKSAVLNRLKTHYEKYPNHGIIYGDDLAKLLEKYCNELYTGIVLEKYLSVNLERLFSKKEGRKKGNKKGETDDKG